MIYIIKRDILTYGKKNSTAFGSKKLKMFNFETFKENKNKYATLY